MCLLAQTLGFKHIVGNKCILRYFIADKRAKRMTHKTLLEQLNWRYATKKMDPTKVVPQAKVDTIIEAIRLAPTSSGTQPFELIVVTNPDVKNEICKAASDQSPVTDGSHLLVFAAWDNYTDARIDAVAALNVEKRGDLPLIGQYYGNLKASYVPRDADVNYAHAARQAYIALGIAMVAAAEQEVDSTPMEGFDPSKVDEILGLKSRGLRSVVLLPLGYRDPTGDWLLNMAKVRKSRETMVTQID
jgi:nitroreductase/dihydropteridine reductase